MTEEQFKTLCEKIENVEDTVIFHFIILMLMIMFGVFLILVKV